MNHKNFLETRQLFHTDFPYINSQHILTIFVIIFISLSSSGFVKAQQADRQFIIAIRSDLEPFSFLNSEGEPAGMMVDIWRLWAKKTGKDIKFVASDWKTSFENLKRQKADILLGFLYSPEYFEWMMGSQPFYETTVNLFYPKERGAVSDIKEFSGQTLGTIRGSQLELFLFKNFPDIHISTFATREDLVKATREGKIKGFISTLQVGAVTIDRLGLSGEFNILDKPFHNQKFQAGVLKKNTELIALINKGLNAISNEEKSEIEARWIADPRKRYFMPSNRIKLSDEEEAWLKNHKTIRVGMSPVIPPLKFLERGIIKGIEPDYLNLLSEATGIDFQYVVGDFSKLDGMVKSGDVDMFISFYIPERLEYMRFSAPLMEFKQVIIARSDAPFISGLGALKGKTIATIKGVKLYEKILNPYPEIKVFQTGNTEEMFEAVSNNNADALISRTYSAGYLMQNYPNLKIAGIADLPSEPYVYAIRKDYPELVSLINKAIATISNEQRDAIFQKWSSIRIEYRPNWFEILKWMLIVGGSLTLLLTLALLTNRRLSREIAKRIEAEEERYKITKRLSLACRAGGIGIWEWNVLENVLIWDDQMFQLYGIKPDDFKGVYEAWQALAHPDDLSRVEEELRTAVSGEKDFVSEFRVVWPDKTIHFIYALAIVQRDETGQALKFIGTNYDITAHKQAEEARNFYTEELIRSNVELQQFAYIASHDLQEPLRMISSYLQLIERRYKGKLDEDADTFIHFAVDGASRMQMLIDGLLEFSRVKTHGQTFEPVDIGLVLDGVCRNLNTLIVESKAVVLYEKMPIIHADEAQIIRLFQNLVQNALKFSKEKNNPIIDITANTTNEGHIFCVKDNGIGIDEQFFERIFILFQRLHAREQYPGTGIGLAICKRIVERHKGKIWVTSKIDQGAAFYFSIPQMW